jgi:hydrogenase-4 component H
MKLPCLLQPRILKTAFGALFSRPYTTRFPAAPFEPIPQFRGRPRFDADACIGCGACAQVCPAKCIEVVDEVGNGAPVRRLVHHLDACIWCGQCERYCTTGAGIRMSSEWDTVGFKPEDFQHEVVKPLVLCEVCGDVVAPADQLRWVAERLGPLVFANPTLLLFDAQAQGLADAGVRVNPEDVRRTERMAMLCARCRRRTALVA